MSEAFALSIRVVNLCFVLLFGVGTPIISLSSDAVERDGAGEGVEGAEGIVNVEVSPVSEGGADGSLMAKTIGARTSARGAVRESGGESAVFAMELFTTSSSDPVKVGRGGSRRRDPGAGLEEVAAKE
jgi:hypothetical protein